MEKYIIVPKKGIEFEVEGKDAADALVNFATCMDSDIGIYFEAIKADEIESYKLHQDLEEQKRMYLEFAEDVLLEDFENEDGEPSFTEEEVKEIAEITWELYCGDRKGGEGLTEYECIEKAVDIWESKHNEDDENEIRDSWIGMENWRI